MFSRLLKLTFGCGSVFMRYAILVLLYIQPEYILLKLITITCVHTQDVESQATEPTEQSAKVLESKTKSMIFLLMHSCFSIGCVLNGMMKNVSEMSVTCLVDTILDMTMKDK